MIVVWVLSVLKFCGICNEILWWSIFMRFEFWLFGVFVLIVIVL